MVLNYLSTDTLEEVPTIEHYKKLTKYVLVVQIIVTVLYHFGRTSGSGIYYGWTWRDYYYAEDECNRLEYDSTNVNWTKYQCDDYFKILYSDSDYDYDKYYDTYDEYHNTHWKCKSIRNQNNDVSTSYSNWVNDGCTDNFTSPDVDYYCAWDIYECNDYFSHIVTNYNYLNEDDCKNKNKGDDYRCDYYFDNFDSPNYICKNHNSSTHKNWTHACNCKDYTSREYHRVEKYKCTDYSNTSTYTCNYNNTNHPFYDNACSCKDYVLNASQWSAYDCYKEYNNENWEPSDAGISFPWVAGMWFVLAVWTTTLPQEFKNCFKYTLISLIINIAADTVNSFYDYGKTTYTLVGFSFIIVFPCLTLMKKAFQKLELCTKEKELINLRTIALKKIRTMFLIGLAQLYISLPAYQHTFEQSLEGEEDDWITLLRHIIPTATGGIFNVAYVVSILFVDITRLHFVDFLNGDTYKLEFLIGLFQVIGFALVLGLNAWELPKKEEIVLEKVVNATEETDIPYVISKQYPDSAYDQYDMIQNIYWSTIGCIGVIWIFIIFLVAHVKNDGSYMKYFEHRCMKRETATTLGIRKEIIKNHSIINKDEIIKLKKIITNELEKVLIGINNLFSNGRSMKLSKHIIKMIQNEIDTSLKETILPYQSINEFGDLKSKKDLMEQWYNLSRHKVQKPLKKLKCKINQHLTNEKNKLDSIRNSFTEHLMKRKQFLEQIESEWTRLFQYIEDKVYSQLDLIEPSIDLSAKTLRTNIYNYDTINIKVCKELENALVELEIYTEQEVCNLTTSICNYYSDSTYTKIFNDFVQKVKFSSEKSMLKFVDLLSDKSYDDHYDVLIDETFDKPLKSLKNIFIVHVYQQKNLAKPQEVEKLNKLSKHIVEQFHIVEDNIKNKQIEIRKKLTNELEHDVENQVDNKITAMNQENSSQENENLHPEVLNLRKENKEVNLRLAAVEKNEEGLNLRKKNDELTLRLEALEKNEEVLNLRKENKELNLRLAAVEKILVNQDIIDLEVGGEEKKEK